MAVELLCIGGGTNVVDRAEVLVVVVLGFPMK